MATYKVPQNVEAEDKLIGFLSLKQFIFVIIGLGAGYLTFLFATTIHPLACIPFIPFTIIFLVLGLYQRADQPVEVYLASAIRFRLKPHKRVWDQEGYEERVIITAPPKIEKHYTKGYSKEQVSSHLGNLSRLMDTRGWASKLATDWQNPSLGAAANSDRLVQPDEIVDDAADQRSYSQPIDIQDTTSSLVAREFDAKIQQSDVETHQKALRALERARQDTPGTATTAPVSYAAYPSMHQRTIQPATTPHDTPAESTPTTIENIENQPLMTEEPTLQAHNNTDEEVEIKLH